MLVVAVLLLVGACNADPALRAEVDALKARLDAVERTPGPAGPMGPRGEAGAAAKVPHLVVASNHLDLGPYLTGNCAWNEQMSAEVCHTPNMPQTQFAERDCAGDAFRENFDGVVPRASALLTGLDGGLFRPESCAATYTARSVYFPDERGCVNRDDQPAPSSALLCLRRIGQIMPRRSSELAIEIR